MNLNLPPWPPERIDALRALCLAGLSSGAMSRELGVTRNAIIGQARRRGFPLSYKGNSRDSGSTGEQRQARAVAVLPKPPKPPPIPIVLPTDADMPLPTSRPCTLLELTGTHCRWPLGHPREPDFRFCGAEKEPERSYCAGHAAMARSPGTWSERAAAIAPKEAA